MGPIGGDDNDIIPSSNHLLVVRFSPSLVAGTEHRCLSYECLQRRWQLVIIAVADDSWADGGGAVHEQGGCAQLPEEKFQKLDAVGSVRGVVQGGRAPYHPCPRDLHERLRPRHARLDHHRAPVEFVLLRVPQVDLVGEMHIPVLGIRLSKGQGITYRLPLSW